MKTDIFKRAAELRIADEAAYRAGKWFAAMLGDQKAQAFCIRAKGLGLVKAGGEGINPTGGYLVPSEIENAIIAQRAVAGVFRQEADVRTMGSDDRSFPKRATGISIGFTAEGALVPETSAVFGSALTEAKKIGALIRSSSELLEDEAADLGRYFVEEFGNAFAALEDDCGFNGTGASTYGGIVGITQKLVDGSHDASKVTAASGHDTWPEIDATDLSNLQSALPEQFWPNAKWYASGVAVGKVFSRLGMTSAGFRDTPNGPRPQYYFGGFPIVPTPKLPTTSSSQTGAVMLLFGDLRSASILGSRRMVTVERSDKPYFAEDQILTKGTERFDVNNHSLGDNTTAGAIVGLVGG